MNDPLIPSTDAERVDSLAMRNGHPSVAWANTVSNALPLSEMRSAVEFSKDASIRALATYVGWNGTGYTAAATLRWVAERAGVLPAVEAALLQRAEENVARLRTRLS